MRHSISGRTGRSLATKMRTRVKTIIAVAFALACAGSLSLGLLVGRRTRPVPHDLRSVGMLLSAAVALHESHATSDKIYSIDGSLDQLIADVASSTSYRDLPELERRLLQVVKKYRHDYPPEPRGYPHDERLAKMVNLFLAAVPDIEERPPPNPRDLGPNGEVMRGPISDGLASLVLRLTCQDADTGASITTVNVTCPPVAQFVSLRVAPQETGALDYRFVIPCGMTTFFRGGQYIHEASMADVMLSFSIEAAQYGTVRLDIPSTSFSPTNPLPRQVQMRKKNG